MIKDIFALDMKINETTSGQTVNKTLHTKFERMFAIKELYEQLNELKHFQLI